MKFEDIIKLEDDWEKLKELGEYSNSRNLTFLEKTKFLSGFNDQDAIVDFFKNDYTFSNDIFIYAINNLLDYPHKQLIVNDNNYSWIVDRISNQNLSRNEISNIIDAYDGQKDALKLFNNASDYYKDNEALILRKTTDSYDENAIDRILDIEDPSLNKDTIKGSLRRLLSVNEDVLETVNFRMLLPRFKDLGDKITVVTMYPEIQNKIIGLTANEYSFFIKSLNYLEFQNIDWVPLADGLLDHVKEYGNFVNGDVDFAAYISDLNVESGEIIPELDKILAIMTSKNKYQLDKFSDLESFDRKRRCDDYLIENLSDEEFEKLSSSDKMRSLIFERVFGQSLDTAKRFYNYYCRDYKNTINATKESRKDIEEYVTNILKIPSTSQEHNAEVDKIIQSNNMVYNYLRVSKKIFGAQNVEALKKMYKATESIEDIYIPDAVFDSTFRRFFARQKSKEIYRPKEKDKVRIGNEDAYLVSDKFGMQIISLEAYRKIGDSPTVPDWNSRKISNHLISTVYVGNSNLSHPPINGVCYAFANNDERSLQKSAPYDLGAWAYAKEFDAYKRQAEFTPKFQIPKTQLRSTLRRHNEDVLERKNYNYEQEHVFKLQPDYTVSFVEPSLSAYFKRPLKKGEVLTKELLEKVLDTDKLDDKSYRADVASRCLKNDKKWKKTCIDANQKGIPKAIVDRTREALKQRMEIDKKVTKILTFTNKDMQDDVKKEEYFNLLEDIIYDFESNRAGVTQREVLGWQKDGSSEYGDLLHKELYENVFSSDVMNDILYRIEQEFNKFDKRNYNQCMEKMKEISITELDNLETQYWWYERDPSHDWQEYYMYAANCLSGINYKKEKQYEKVNELLEQNMNGTGTKAGNYIKGIIDDIAELKEYDIPKNEPDWHGRKHINDVVLFSYLIAKNEGEDNDRNMELLLQAAKYHDVGRDGNWNGQGNGKRHDKDDIPHAYPSALAAEFYMKQEIDEKGNRKYKDEEIAMVKVAIHYHEVREKNRKDFDEDTFKNMCENEGVKEEDYDSLKKMCVYLKDADALDRTRFLYEIPGSRNFKEYPDNLDVRFLRTNTAIAIRDFARDISDKHYENKVRKIDKLYIPDVLDKYKGEPSVPHKERTEEIKDIANFLVQKNSKQNRKKLLTKEDLMKLVTHPENKEQFMKKRFSVKGLFKGLVNREKQVQKAPKVSDNNKPDYGLYSMYK